MKAKLLYNAPTSKIFEVRLEGLIATSDPDLNSDGNEKPIDDGSEGF